MINDEYMRASVLFRERKLQFMGFLAEILVVFPSISLKSSAINTA